MFALCFIVRDKIKSECAGLAVECRVHYIWACSGMERDKKTTHALTLTRNVYLWALSCIFIKTNVT